MMQVQNDRKIYLKDILIEGAVDCDKARCLTANYSNCAETMTQLGRYLKGKPFQLVFKGVTQEEYDALFISSDKQLQILKADTPNDEMQRVDEFDGGSQGYRVYGREGKSQTLSALGGGAGAKTGLIFACLTPDRVNKRQNGGRFKKDGKAFTLTAQDKHGVAIVQKGHGFNRGAVFGDGKTPTLTSNSWEHNNHILNEIGIRKLHPIECERLMNLPDGYTEGVSNSQRYKMLGNGWDVFVVAELLKGLIEAPLEIQLNLPL